MRVVLIWLLEALIFFLPLAYFFHLFFLFFVNLAFKCTHAGYRVMW